MAEATATNPDEIATKVASLLAAADAEIVEEGKGSLQQAATLRRRILAERLSMLRARSSGRR